MEPQKRESRALESILGGMPVSEFFKNVFQKACAIFEGDASSRDPFGDLITKNFATLLQLMYASDKDDTVSLLFRDQEQLPRDQYINAFSAYLDGCSVVVNHADTVSSSIATLCDDLQLSIPHVYVNAYITPPHSQAVKAHADDRDVFVVQVHGSKVWKVYRKVPVPLPYPHEQVGKDGRIVPEHILNETMICHTLKPGEVLYMPRGYVHEAMSTSEGSFHVTVAIATHDWTLAGVIGDMTRNILAQDLSMRFALPRELGTGRALDETAGSALQEQIQLALRQVQENITIEAIDACMKEKFAKHNVRAALKRGSIKSTVTQKPTAPVGEEAATHLSLSTILRLSTDDEKNSVRSSEPKGLFVREENQALIMGILSKFREDPSLQCKVENLLSLVPDTVSKDFACPLTLVSFARVCVELGALALVLGE